MPSSLATAFGSAPHCTDGPCHTERGQTNHSLTGEIPAPWEPWEAQTQHDTGHVYFHGFPSLG
eukprot:10250591-Alexandrium_andersonii.AAC.1